MPLSLFVQTRSEQKLSATGAVHDDLVHCVYDSACAETATCQFVSTSQRLCT